MEKPKQTRIAAYGLILQDSEILLCRLSSLVPNHAGRWTLPGGGIEFGESPADALVREAEEETGLAIEPKEVVDIDSMLIDRAEKLHHAIRIIYRTTLLGGTLRDEVGGTTDRCQWWPIDSCPPLVSIAQRGIEIVLAG